MIFSKKKTDFSIASLGPTCSTPERRRRRRSLSPSECRDVSRISGRSTHNNGRRRRQRPFLEEGNECPKRETAAAAENFIVRTKGRKEGKGPLNMDGIGRGGGESEECRAPFSLSLSFTRTELLWDWDARHFSREMKTQSPCYSGCTYTSSLPVRLFSSEVS